MLLLPKVNLCKPIDFYLLLWLRKLLSKLIDTFFIYFQLNLWYAHVKV